MNESHIEWVPTHGKAIEILNPKSVFMSIVSEMKEYKIPI